MLNIIRQNNAADIYQECFEEDKTEDDTEEQPFAKTINFFRWLLKYTVFFTLDESMTEIKKVHQSVI